MNAQEIAQAWSNAEKCRNCQIRDLVLFADLQEDDFYYLHQPIKDIELPGGMTLYRENESPEFVYTLRFGLIKLVRCLPDGTTRIVRIVRQGELVGIEALSGSAYLQQAIALTDCKLCCIPLETIELLNRNSPRLYRQLTGRWHAVQRDADRWLTQFSTGSARKRMAKLLLYLADGDYCFLPCREDLGAILAITTETASRIIAEFKREDIIRIDRHSAHLHKSLLEKIR